MSNEFTKFLKQSLLAGSPLVYCETSEDERLRDLAFDLVDTDSELRDVRFLSWTCTTGLSGVEDGKDVDIFTAEAVPTFEQLLGQLVTTGNQHHFGRNLILVARDAVGPASMHEGSTEASLRFVRLLKDLHEIWEPMDADQPRRCLVLTGLGWTPPPGLNGYLQTTVLPLPTQLELREEFGTGFEAALRRRGLGVDAFAGRVAGLPLLAVRDIARRLELPTATPGKSDDPWSMIDHIKKEEIRKTGVLEILPTSEYRELGGFGEFKRWFLERKPFLATRDRPELLPRGVLFLGFPGCGKSHAARWIAGELGMPLIALSLGQVQDRWVGASEANFRLALSTLEASAPVVVLMDEVEKDIAGHGTDSSGVMTHLVGHLLRWLADRKAPVFIVATCNKAESIPVELTRTGRFDANFIVTVPSHRERDEIVRAIGKGLGLEIPDDVRAFIVDQTDDFTGAEIRQLLIEAAYKVGPNVRRLTRDSIAAARPSVTPLMRREDGQRLWSTYKQMIGNGYRLVGEERRG